MAARVIDLQKKREKKNQIAKDLRAQEGLRALRSLISSYELLMEVFGPTLSPEELADFSSLSPREQLNDDLGRLNALADILESMVGEKNVTLSEAFLLLKESKGGELSQITHYLLESSFPLFKAMLQAIEWSSLPVQSSLSSTSESAETSCKVKKIDL